MTAPFIPDDPHDWARRWAWPIIGHLRAEIEPISALVLVALAGHGDQHGTAYPGIRRLADITGRSRQAVTRALLLLRDEHKVISGDLAAKKAAPWTFIMPAYLATPRALPDDDLATPKGLPDTPAAGSELASNWQPSGNQLVSPRALPEVEVEGEEDESPSNAVKDAARAATRSEKEQPAGGGTGNCQTAPATSPAQQVLRARRQSPLRAGPRAIRGSVPRPRRAASPSVTDRAPQPRYSEPDSPGGPEGPDVSLPGAGARMTPHAPICACEVCMAVSAPQVERTGSLRETAARLERVANRLEQAIAALDTSTAALREDERDR